MRWSRRAWFGGFARWAGGKRGLWDQEELRRRRAEQRKERSEGTCWVSNTQMWGSVLDDVVSVGPFQLFFCDHKGI